MARKKNMTAEKIIDLYMSTLLLENEIPKTVYAFAHANNFEESEFYKYFGSFEVLEKQIFSLFCENTIAMLMENEDYATYTPINKLLSFYYTFFEMLNANRSFVYLKLAQNKNKLDALKLLSKLRVTFLKYIEAEIYEQTIDLKNKTLNSISKKGVNETAWAQLLFTMQFWIEDTSPNFEKTDIFIEKSVQASFDLKNIKPLESVLDFAKFLWKEKTMST
ncbi:TetR family transcriptional regulator C-terminal domain-containing protein [Algibacter pacificus]|uniref:TetR family transcriptional regulator C-terminal domain-containing protein n=1 Tax=Algibacter pacificus TaxID=2599389 RepID=UPI0011C7123D|nr:TetR family transcriptional regulator C-terminal domain-containing protein [Algibacter pacificus]